MNGLGGFPKDLQPHLRYFLSVSVDLIEGKI